jgi:hypothetical protein
VIATWWSALTAFVRFAVAPASTMSRRAKLGAGVLGLSLATTVAVVLPDWRSQGAAAGIVTLALVVVAGVRLQRRLDTRPRLELILEPGHTYSPGFHEGVSYGGTARFCSVWVTADQYAERCYGRVVACEARDAVLGFTPLTDFMGAVELRWPKSPMQHEIDIEPDVPERLVVCMGLKESNRVYLGTETGMGSALALPPGEYRFKVRVGVRAWNVPDAPVEHWLRVKHAGLWEQVQLMPDE